MRMNTTIRKLWMGAWLALAVAVLAFPARAGEEIVDMVEWVFDIGPEGAVVREVRQTAGDVLVPDSLGGQPVMEIASGAFSGCDGLTSVTFQEPVQRIGTGAFYKCGMLEKMALLQSVERG